MKHLCKGSFTLNELIDPCKISVVSICDALRDLVPFVQFKKLEKNTHGGVLILVKLQVYLFALLFESARILIFLESVIKFLDIH